MAAGELDPRTLAPVLSAHQVADLLHVHVNTVKKLCRSGKLPAFKAGARWRVRREDLLAFTKVSLEPQVDGPGVASQPGPPPEKSELAEPAEAATHQGAWAETLLRLAQRLNEQNSLEAVLRAICEETARALNVPASSVALHDEERAELRHALGYGLPPEYAARTRPIPRTYYETLVQQTGLFYAADVQTYADAPDATLYADLDIRSVVGISLIRDEHLLGSLNLFTFGEVRHFSEDEMELLQGLAHQAVLAIANARLFEAVQRELADRRQAQEELLASRRQLQYLTRRLVEVQEEERRSLSRDLHDEAGQNVTSLKLNLGLFLRDPECPPSLRPKIEELRQAADTAGESLHRLAMNLRPSSLDRYGLVPALEGYIATLAKQSGLEIQFLSEGLEDRRLQAGVETALYRIVQEALTNVARHARARRAGVVLQRRGDRILLILEDDGVGFDVDDAWYKGRLGLLGMRERTQMLGGTMTVESRPGSGTTIHIDVPIEPVDAAREGAGDHPTMFAGEATDLLEVAPVLREGELARGKALGDALNDWHAEIAALQDPALILQRTIERAGQAIGCDVATVLVREGKDWVVQGGYRLPQIFHGRRYTGDDIPPYLPFAARTREVVVVDDAFNDPRFSRAAAERYSVHALLCIPVELYGGAACVLTLADHSHARHYTPAEARFAHRIKTSLVLVLENARLRTVQQQQGQELARRVEELQTLLELLPAGIGIAYDAECKDIQVNPALAQMLGMTPGSNVSLSADEAAREADYHVFQDGRELQPDELPMQVAARGVVVRDSVIDIVLRDGSTRTLLSEAVPLFDSAGTPRGAVSAFVDITERRAAEKAVNRLNEDLQQWAAEQQAILDAIADGLVIYSESGELLRINRVAEGLLGYVGQELGKKFDERARRLRPQKPNGQPFELSELPAVRALRGETVQGCVMAIQRPDGTVWVSASAAPITAHDGGIRGAVATFTDITRLQQIQRDLEDTTQELEAATEELQMQAAELETKSESQREQNERLLLAVEKRDAALRESQARAEELNAIQLSMTEGLTIADAHGNILAMNPAGLKILRFERLEDAQGFFARYGSFLQVSYLDGRPMPPEEWPLARALLGETFTDHEVIVERHDLGWRSIQSYGGAAVRNAQGEIVLAINTFRDITAQKQVEARLRESEERLRQGRDELEARVRERTASLAATAEELEAANRSLLVTMQALRESEDRFRVALKNSPVLVFHQDRELRYTWIYNPHPAWTPEQILGRTDFDELPHEDAAKLAEVKRRAMETGTAQQAEVRTTINGEPFFYQLAVEPMHDASGKIIGITGAAMDVTERKRTEQQLRETLRELEASRGELRALSRRLVAIQERERRYVADQLFNEAGQVLAALKMELGRSQGGEGQMASLEETQELLDRVMQHLLRLAADLHPATLKWLGLPEAIKQYAEAWGGVSQVKVQVESVKLEGARLNKAVETAVYRVVQEALMNVAEHAAARTVSIVMTCAGSQLAVVVEDDGVGFEPAVLMNQAALGLASMRERLEAVGGKLIVESTPGSGTSVIAQVPAECAA